MEERKRNEMERLTEKYLSCNQIKDCGNETCEETCKKVSGCSECPIKKAIDKLARYEELEERGLLEIRGVDV